MCQYQILNITDMHFFFWDFFLPFYALALNGLVGSDKAGHVGL